MRLIKKENAILLMDNQLSLLGLLMSLWHRASPPRRVQFFGVLALMIIASFAEILSLGSVLPFLGVLIDPAQVFGDARIHSIIVALSIKSPQQLLLPLTIAFIFFALFAGLTRLMLVWANTNFSYALGADFSLEIYRRTLYQPYQVHLDRNSSEIISGISGKVDRVINIINMSLNLIGSSIMLTAILGTMLVINAQIAILSIFSFSLIYLTIIKFTKKYIIENSVKIAAQSSALIRALQEGLGGIRDILIDGTQEIYCEVYKNSDQILRSAQGANLFISQSPRYLVETLGMILIAFIAFILTNRVSYESTSIIPLMGMLAFGAQRMLPVLQQAYGAWTTMLGAKASLVDVIALLDQPFPQVAKNSKSQPLSFHREIELKNVSFKYNVNSQFVLQRINLQIPKGVWIGVIGETGSGKSTLLDILMGLLTPTEGNLVVDGECINQGNYQNWQARIAHVPQSIFLTDATIAENIAFGVPVDQIDSAILDKVAHDAELFDLIQSLPNKYKTLVGERGIKLSGGQRQRIGIARALYKKADVIILDEATSALDEFTEAKVMESIRKLANNRTVIIVAHRITTLKNTDWIMELDGGKFRRVINYSEIK